MGKLAEPTQSQPISQPAGSWAEADGTRASTSRLSRYGRLVVTWVAAGILSLLIIATYYTFFVGRDKAAFNEAIFENNVLINAPHSEKLLTSEGHGVTTYGENGLVVDKEVDFSRPRILFIGDSYVEAKQVSDSEKFTEIVQNTWNETHPDRPLQTLNLGLASLDMRHYITYGRNMDKVFAPNLVFMVLSQWDFMPIARNSELLAEYESDPSVKLVKPEKLTPLQTVMSNSLARQFFIHVQSQTEGFLAQSGGGGDADAEAQLANVSSDILQGKEAIVHDQLKALQDIWGDRLVILYNTYDTYYGGDTPPTFVDDTLIHEAERLGIPVVNLYEPLLGSFAAEQPPRGFNNSILGTGHFNQLGHKIVARQILDYLETIDLGK